MTSSNMSADSVLSYSAASINSNEDMHKTQACSQLKGETVEQHPLARSASNSSSSSAEIENSNGTLRFTAESKKLPQRKGRVPSVGRLRELLIKSDENRVDSTDGNVYYNLWQNKGKILTNRKKQATESVRSLTQSASFDAGFNQGIFHKSHEDSLDCQASAKSSVNSNSSSQIGLFKAASDNITENQQDSDVSSFLQGFKEKVSDPLMALRQKEEEDKKKEEDLFDELSPLPRSPSTYSSGSTLKDSKKRLEFPKQPQKPSVTSSKKSTLAVSLSSLMASKSEVLEEEILSVGPASPVEMQPVEKKLNRDTAKTKPTVAKKNKRSHAIEEPPSTLVIVTLSLLVYFYIILPLPFSLRIACTCFVFGCSFAAAFLCVFAPGSRRPQPFLPPVKHHMQSSKALSMYNPDHLIRGWMNEIPSYEPDKYHISNTHSVFVTLDAATLRLQTPFKNIARRSMYNEGSIPITNVVQSRLFDITFAKVYLQPSGLVKKRVWSKKYPICVEIPNEKQRKDELDIDRKTENSMKDVKFLYLFGRTDRQKEEWFYRIQRSINVALARHNKKLKTAQSKLSEQGLADACDEWGIIEDHYEEESCVSIHACDITKLNDQPIRMLQDYFVHISRLFPESMSGLGSPKPKPSKSQEKATEKTVDESQVSWLNVFMGRIMFDFLRQPVWSKWLSVKVQRKLDKIKLPYFMDELKLTEMDLGTSVPFFHEISLPKLDSQGIWFEAEITYSGTVQMTLRTKLVLTKLGKNETLLMERESSGPTDAINDSDAEDSAESSDDDAESTVTRFVGHLHNAVAKWDKQFLKDAIRGGKEAHVGDGSSYAANPPQADTLPSSTSGAPPKKWIRIVDSITKSKYFQKATETDYIRKKLETVSNTPMLLTVELVQLKGTLVINIPPPPTDRVWYGFREPPMMLLKAHPKVGERVVKTTHVTDWIENKLQQEVTKILVMPNMDDIPIPIMFHNRHDPS